MIFLKGADAMNSYESIRAEIEEAVNRMNLPKLKILLAFLRTFEPSQ